MEPDTAPCEKCQSQIPITAEMCPACGYDPQSNGRLMRKVFFVGGLLLTLSIVGAPVGVPMLVLYYVADRKVSEKTAVDA